MKAIHWIVYAYLISYVPTTMAAKMHVSWVAPTTNVDGSPLVDLVGYRVEWGSCNADGSFGTYQAGINVASVQGVPLATDVWIYPTGLTRVCAHVFAINSTNTLSVASNTASGVPPPVLSQPTT
jgi:hypothetical protein